MIEHIFTESSMEKNYGYCRATVVDDWIFVSGTAGTDYKTGIMPEDVAAQTHGMLDNLERALKAAGSGFEDIVKRCVYVGNFDDQHVIYPIIIERMKGHCTPASQGFAVQFLKTTIKVEMSVIAKRGAGKKK